ncbi:MAG: MarR family transcriptional regulator [Ruminococcus sp.]|nr:MarR family transcriptional regulator [Ruminococcus sp.]
MSCYDCLKLKNQLCFPLYACSREIIKKYRPYLDELDLTYTQYIAMMVFWEDRRLSVKELGGKLFLDSGTLTPVLKSLESKGFVKRFRSSEDERVLLVEVTDEGMKLRDRAVDIPEKVGSCVDLAPEEAELLYRTLYKILGRQG